ncbi:hypothetical protein OAI49_01300 [Synechococcus sp. AH-558-M21]|nr:hypothetical protein [Synechococcus sp. BS307-5m-G35]MDC0165618.1 hypothetical protein [Synechococcus sp. AH-558-M21]
MSVPDIKSAYDPSEQLARLQRQCRLRSVAIYRDQALYLQVLRDEVQAATRQALFSLLSEVDPARFSRLSGIERSRFHAAVQDLTKRCSVLLTVEQLMHLVTQMHDEQRRQQAHASREMLQGLSKNLQETKTATQQDQTDPPRLNRADPAGSVHLSLASPLGSPPVAPMNPFDQPQSEASDESETVIPGDEDDQQQNSDLDVLQSLFQLAGDVMQPSGPVEDWMLDSPSSPSSEGGDHLLPTRPDALLHWMQSMDLALSRRLRNLSHAVNVQMLRAGLAQALLPITLLEAVQRGQMETQPTASNVLRIRMPLAMGELEPGMDVFSILIRTSELEFDSHRLRRCRNRLRQHHHDLTKMVGQQRHWERRSLDREARTHWQTPPDSTPLDSTARDSRSMPTGD